MKKILIILTGVLLVYGEPVIAKNELTGITIVKKISKAKKKTKKVAKKTSQKKKKVKRVADRKYETRKFLERIEKNEVKRIKEITE